MRKTSIEQLTTSLALILLLITTTGTILLMADLFFKLDIFNSIQEKALGFVLVSMFLVIVSSVVINIMINIGIIAETLQKRDSS